jgi:hypothetical protein
VLPEIRQHFTQATARFNLLREPSRNDRSGTTPSFATACPRLAGADITAQKADLPGSAQLPINSESAGTIVFLVAAR